MKDPFGELLELMLVLWRDALFLKLLAAVVALSTMGNHSRHGRHGVPGGHARGRSAAAVVKGCQ